MSDEEERKRLLDRNKIEIEKGLKDIDLFPSGLPDATVAAVIREYNAIDDAIEAGRHSPLPDTF